jgi:hypothetical protein
MISINMNGLLFVAHEALQQLFRAAEDSKRGDRI